MADDDQDTYRHEGDTIRDVVTGGSGWFLLVVAFGWFLTLGSRFLVPALLPVIKHEFAVENTGAGLIVTVIWLTYGAMQFPAGILSDRVGERTLLGASTLLAGLSMVGLAAAPTYPLFLVAGGAFGIATGLYGPARGTALTKRFDEFEGLAFGLVLAAGSVGTAVLPFAATVASDWVGWRWAVGALVPGFIIAGLGLLLKVPSSLGGGGSTGSIGLGLVQSARALRTRRVGIAVVAIILLLFTFKCFTAFFTTYLTSIGSLSQSTAGGLFALLFLSGAVFQLGAGRMADAFGYRRVLVGVSLVSVGPLLALTWAPSLGWYGVVTVFIGIRMALGPMTNAYIIGSLPDENTGAIWGFIRTGFFVLAALGSTAVGTLVDAGYFDATIVALAGLTAVGGVLYYLLPREPV